MDLFYYSFIFAIMIFTCDHANAYQHACSYTSNVFMQHKFLINLTQCCCFAFFSIRKLPCINFVSLTETPSQHTKIHSTANIEEFHQKIIDKLSKFSVKIFIIHTNTIAIKTTNHQSQYIC